MLITFQSAAAADVIMFGDVAQRLLTVLGKDTSTNAGIVTVEQLPDAIAALRRAIEDDKHRHSNDDDADDDDQETPRGMAAPVSFHQRAWPLLEMLEYSLKEGKPVTWGT
jgi:uncharacterized protein YgbK (DUF1537 family)